MGPARPPSLKQSPAGFRTASKTTLRAWPQLQLPEPGLQAVPRELKEVSERTGPGDVQEGDTGQPRRDPRRCDAAGPVTTTGYDGGRRVIQA